MPYGCKGAAIKKYAAFFDSSDMPPTTLGLSPNNSYLRSVVPLALFVELNICCMLPFKFCTVPTLPNPSIPLSLVDI